MQKWANLPNHWQGLERPQFQSYTSNCVQQACAIVTLETDVRIGCAYRQSSHEAVHLSLLCQWVQEFISQSFIVVNRCAMGVSTKGGSLPTTCVEAMVEQTCSLDAPHTQLVITHVLGKMLWIRLSELAAEGLAFTASCISLNLPLSLTRQISCHLQVILP